MAVPLAQLTDTSSSALKKGVVDVFTQTSSILERLSFLQLNAAAYKYNEAVSLPGVAWRSINGAHPESTGVIAPKVETLKILGGDADVDIAADKIYSDMFEQRASQTTLKTKALAFDYNDSFFNGDSQGNPLEIDGLRARLTGSQVIEASSGTSGLPVIGGSVNDIHAFLDKLQELTDAVVGFDGSNGALFANKAIIGKIKSALRRVNEDIAHEQVGGKMLDLWNGIALLDPGETAAGDAVLGIDELATDGTTPTTSIYAVRFAKDEGDVGVIGLANGGVEVRDLGELQEKPALRTRIEFINGLAIFNGKSAARLKGVVNG